MLSRPAARSARIETREAVERDRLTTPLLVTMAAACALGIANLNYSQPLLGQMQRSLHTSIRAVGSLPMLTQVGFAVGVLFLAPLGDILERRRLILAMLALVTISLAAAALAPSLPFLCGASLAIGVTSVISTLVLPFAVYLSQPDQRGRTVGTIAASMLIGLLLSRTISGIVGQAFGWRVMYGVAAGTMIVLALVLKALLPRSRPASAMSYGSLIRSTLGHIRTEPVLRAATLNGMLLYAALCAFWATLVFLVESPSYRMGSAQAGLFGLLGAISALAAPFVGRLADRHSPRMLVGVASLVMLAGFVFLAVAGAHLAGLLAGIVLLDVGAQSATISNQASVYSLAEEAHSRLYTVYRAGYSLGGSVGAFLGVYAWSIRQWAGVCAVGISLVTVALLVHLRTSRAQR